MDRLEDRLSEIDEMRSDLKTQTKKMLATKQEMSANADRLRMMERTNTGSIKSQNSAVRDLLEALKISFALENCQDRE